MTNKELLLVMKLKDEVTKRITTIQGRLQKFGNTLKKNFLAIGATIFLVQKTIGSIVNAAVDFEDAFAGVKKTVNATEAEFRKLSGRLLEMSRNIPIGATELARIQELAGQLGVSGVEELTKFTDTVAKISVTTNLTSESAATDFARIANIMKLPLKEVDRLASAVVELGNTSATTESEIVEFANRIAGAGSIVGLSTADILGFGAAFTSVGIKAERGGTAINKTLIDMAEAINKGGKDLQNFAQLAGLSSEEFSKAFEEDAATAFALFIEGLGRRGVEGVKVLEKLGLNNARLRESFLSVGGAGGLLTESIKKSNLAWEANNALTEEAKKRFETTASKIQVIKNNLNVLAVEIGGNLLPLFDKLAEATKKFVDFATGKDLKDLSKLQILEQSLAKIDERLQFMKNAFGRRFIDPSFNQEILDIERQRSVLVGIIHQEMQKQAEAAEKINELTGQTLEKERQNLDEIQTKKSEALVTEFSETVQKEDEKIQKLREAWQVWQDEKEAMQLISLQKEEEQLNFFIDTQKKANESIWVAASQARDTFTQGVSKMFGDMLKGTADAGKAFKDLGLSMVQILIDFAVQKTVNSLLAKSLLATEVAASTVAGATIAAAWAPAAANVSLATFGANAAAASAGIASTHALTTALSIPKLEKGGNIERSGAVLVGEKGPEVLNLPRGALVSPLDKSPSGVNVGDINVFVPVQEGPLNVEELADNIGYEIERRLREGRSFV